jgi:PAS domain S-box-containing protein
MSAGRLGSWEYQIDTGRVIWSPTLERIHGLEPGTFGGTFDDYKRDIHPDDVDRVLGTISRSSHGDIPHHLEYRIVRPDGEVRWLEASGQLLNDAEGRPARMLGVCSDVTERKAAEEIARKAREEAEWANRTKAEFLAKMSHELRTPLNAIGGYLDLLDLGIHGPVTESQRAAFVSIKRNQDHLLVLINDLLNFAQLDAGKLTFNVRPVAAGPFFEGMRPLLTPLADARGIGFVTDPVPDDVRIMVDEDRLQQIMLNLVGNAAKFTPPGGTIGIFCGSAGGSIEIAVRDTGRGIASDKLDAIFDPFVQLDRGTAGRGDRGVGLGLAISRELARAMGGDLTVESKLGQGSTFTVSLPAA